MSGARGWFRVIPLAVLVTALLAGAATWAQSAGIEADLAAKARAALAQAGLQGTVSFDGRDATLSGFPPDKALRAMEVVQAVDGVRAAEISGDVTPYTPAPTPTPPPPSSTPPPPPATTTPAPPPTDKDGLQAEVERMLTDTPVTFVPDSAKLTPEGTQAVRDIAKALSGAPGQFRFRVTGHAGRGSGSAAGALKLSQDRARAVARILIANGVPSGRVSSRGAGDTQPVAGGEDRRIEITVLEG